MVGGKNSVFIIIFLDLKPTEVWWSFKNTYDKISSFLIFMRHIKPTIMRILLYLFLRLLMKGYFKGDTLIFFSNSRFFRVEISRYSCQSLHPVRSVNTASVIMTWKLLLKILKPLWSNVFSSLFNISWSQWDTQSAKRLDWVGLSWLPQWAADSWNISIVLSGTLHATKLFCYTHFMSPVWRKLLLF